jgi:hypothetical protein
MNVFLKDGCCNDINRISTILSSAAWGASIATLKRAPSNTLTATSRAAGENQYFQASINCTLKYFQKISQCTLMEDGTRVEDMEDIPRLLSLRGVELERTEGPNTVPLAIISN